MGKMLVREVNEIEHEPYFLFSDTRAGFFYIVAKDSVDLFTATKSPEERARLSDIVLSVPSNKVRKSRFF